MTSAQQKAPIEHTYQNRKRFIWLSRDHKINTIQSLNPKFTRRKILKTFLTKRGFVIFYKKNKKMLFYSISGSSSINSYYNDDKMRKLPIGTIFELILYKTCWRTELTSINHEYNSMHRSQTLKLSRSFSDSLTKDLNLLSLTIKEPR